MGLHHRPRLEPGSERITHPGDQVAGRAVGDDRGVDEHEFGVARMVHDALHLARFGIDHRHGAARRVVRGERRTHHNPEPGCDADGAAGVERLPTPYGDDGAHAGRSGRSDAGVDLDL